MVNNENQKSNGGERAPWMYIAVLLGLTIISSSLLDWLMGGVPIGLALPLIDEPATISKLLYYGSVITVGAYVGFMGLRELMLEKRFSVEFLMAVASIGAANLHLLFEGATVLFLYSLAEYFEGYIEDRSRRAVEKLSKYMPEEAIIVKDASERKVHVKLVKSGATIMVRPGERIPLDGVVVDGASHVDQSLVTGESVPSWKKKNDTVFAGTLNTDGVLIIEVVKEAGQTLVSRIERLVLESRKRKAAIERLVDRFARIYVPIIIVLAIFTAFFMPQIAGGSAENWIYRALILLVISCPSAFIISVPATFFAATAIAARKGVIIKGGVYIEKMDKVRTIVFDKTGTLTFGRPAVREVNCLSQGNDLTALTYAAALEQYSRHPLAESIVKKATDLGLEFQKLEVTEVKEIPGEGISGCVGGCRVAVGSAELMKKAGLGQELQGVENEKHTRVYVSIDQCTPPIFCLVDEVRNDAAQAIKAIKESGTQTVMLTGDRADVAQEVARSLSLDKFYAELLPEEKLKIVGQLRAEHGLVAMVGDGINDAPALAASDVGIAIGSGGVDVTLESADVVLVKNELTKIPYLQRLSKSAVKRARQNLSISLGIKFVLGALGFLGFIPLWFAVAAGDDGVTLLLLLNTLRLPRS